MVDIPENLIEALARRRCALYLGAGVSKQAATAEGIRPPDWKQFLDAGQRRCPGRSDSKKYIRDLINNGDYLTACQIIKSKLDDDWPNLLTDTFNAGYLGKELHEIVFNLDCPLVLTTNFDRIYDAKAAQLSAGTTNVVEYDSPDIARIVRGSRNDRTILKVHGSLNNLDRMIFTREDYARQRQECPTFVRIFESLLSTQTFLFLGCSFNDPDLILLLENYAQAHTAMAPHFALVPKGMHAEIVKTWRKNYNLRIIEYSPNDNHSELVTITNDIKMRVDNVREELADSRLW